MLCFSPFGKAHDASWSWALQFCWGWFRVGLWKWLRAGKGLLPGTGNWLFVSLSRAYIVYFSRKIVSLGLYADKTVERAACDRYIVPSPSKHILTIYLIYRVPSLSIKHRPTIKIWYDNHMIFLFELYVLLLIQNHTLPTLEFTPAHTQGHTLRTCSFAVHLVKSGEGLERYWIWLALTLKAGNLWLSISSFESNPLAIGQWSIMHAIVMVYTREL
jgi:hypothetical protein